MVELDDHATFPWQVNSCATECYILSALSENAHMLEAHLGRNAFHDFATSVEQVHISSQACCTCTDVISRLTSCTARHDT